MCLATIPERIDIQMLSQPDDTSCGPASHHAVYRYFGYDIKLGKLIRDIEDLEDGGTLTVFLGIDALRRGFHARIYSYNLLIFDPSWASLNGETLSVKLEQQLEYKKDAKLVRATTAYKHFLNLGGDSSQEDVTPALLDSYFERRCPILTGLSATYLYNSKREIHVRNGKTDFDDLKGDPVGHFVVLSGMANHLVEVADPYRGNPISNGHHYNVEVNRLINAIMLGVVTYDANLLIVSPVPF